MHKNNLIESRHGLRIGKAIGIFLGFTGIHIPPYTNRKMYLVELYRKGDNPYLSPPDYSFYQTKEWLTLRKEILDIYGPLCMKCGDEGGSPHVDHIKPISFYPELKLDKGNLQVLCRKCNIKKSNKNEIDYRPISPHSNLYWRKV